MLQLPSYHITSLKNPRVKMAAGLRDRRGREKAGLTLLEGYRELSRGLEFGMKIEQVFFCREMFLGANEDELLRSLAVAGAEVFEVSTAALAKLAYRDRPEGLIAVAAVRPHRLEDMPKIANGLYLVVEAIEKPGNLGSMLRSADAVGAAGVLVCDPRADIYNPNVIRASTGALFSVPMALANSAAAATWLRSAGIRTVAGDPHADRLHTEADMGGGIAIVVGAEQYGLSDFWLANADQKVKIPMLGKIDSLNVATAATLLLYEAARQRGFGLRGNQD